MDESFINEKAVQILGILRSEGVEYWMIRKILDKVKISLQVKNERFLHHIPAKEAFPVAKVLEEHCDRKPCEAL